ncbi:MAG TPA: response regulator, partial [Albitalea sp.]|nr:response regulator [Albitalea sp.]
GGIDGTGIGMALTRELLALMHGDIEVASEPGSGTSVRIALPLAAAAQTLALVPPPVAHPRKNQGEGEAEPEGTVLYIEDNPVNMLIVEQMLARWPQVKLAQATDGRRGIALARELRPNLVLLDMRLPDMEGTEVLAALRADAATSLLRVVALSASAMDDEVAHARRCGAFDYWTKPLDFDRFMTEMRRLLPARKVIGPPVASLLPPRAPP